MFLRSVVHPFLLSVEYPVFVLLVSTQCRMRVCAVVGCKSTNNLYTFPTEEELKREWISLCGKKNVNCNDRICGLHFHESNFNVETEPRKHRRLKKGSLPTLHLPGKQQLYIVH